jgi:hypothetical protein
MNSLARAQSNFDARLPPDDSMREAAVEARAEQLQKDYWQDLEQLSDAFSDASVTIGLYRRGKVPHPHAVTFLTLIRDGSDDLEAMRLLREAMRQYIADQAKDTAEEELS